MVMNNTKRILSIVLALVMLFSTNVVAFADDATGEAATEPVTGSTETTQPEQEKASINILLKYSESKSEDCTISDGDIENKTVSELTDDEISKYITDHYPLENQYEVSAVSGRHTKRSFQWEPEGKQEETSKDDTENTPSEPSTENVTLDEEPTTDEEPTETPSVPQNPEQKVYAYTFVAKQKTEEEEQCSFSAEDVEATCVSQGYRKFTCEFCKDVYWGKLVDKLGHDYVATVTDPTCTDKGYTTYVCSRCDDTYTGDEVAAKGHTPGEAKEEDKVNSTCAKEGSYNLVVRCTECNEIITTEAKTIEKKAHTWNDGVVTTEPTEDSEGVKTFTCTVCGETKTESVPPLAHTHVAAEAVRENEVAATCAKEGSYDEVVYCSKCKEELSREKKTIAKIAHTYTTKVENRVEPTAEKEGSYDTVTYCSVCNAEKENSTVVTKITLKSIKPVSYKTVYFIGEKWNEKVQVEATYDDGSKKTFPLTIPKPDKFSTGKENGNMSFSVRRRVSGKETTIVLSGIKCFSPQIVLEGTASNAPYNFFENFSSGMNPSRKIYLRSGVKWNYQVLLSNIKIELSPEAAKVCNITKTSKKQNWKGHPAEKIVKNLADINNKEINAEGTLEINQTKFFNASKKASDYYVTISGKANGKTYKFKVYLYGVTSVKPTTKSTILTFGNPSKFSVNFKENYIDGTYVNHLKKITLSANAVGKTYVSTKINNRTVKYYYYVKCKAPAVKASPAKKAVNLSWKAVKGATGYKVYRSTSKNKGYKCVKTIKNGKTVKYKDTKLKSKKTYYYKVVAVYSKESKCSSSYSSVKSCKTK